MQYYSHISNGGTDVAPHALMPIKSNIQIWWVFFMFDQRCRYLGQIVINSEG